MVSFKFLFYLRRRCYGFVADKNMDCKCHAVVTLLVTTTKCWFLLQTTTTCKNLKCSLFPKQTLLPDSKSIIVRESERPSDWGARPARMNRSDGDSSARPDEPVRTGKSFFVGLPAKKIAANSPPGRSKISELRPSKKFILTTDISFKPAASA